ncbi:putative uncharacterized domain protein [Borreliella afzelii PKo]|uniref:Uncharacterized domain protein n=1 Tax=Borreliella afzelii (strain PKo) TaxID=390236 RepID=G0IS91_BORAP|nr:putative uncharacterized domain protein [Borreliella afzelii PKo]AFU74742.1 hypothetical protein BafHLJ01_0491 [Borreliella afzelii HLJ01]EEC21079.1 hypothetical protein BafACA1_0459 [Borreliella afzelii ACA-1]
MIPAVICPITFGIPIFATRLPSEIDEITMIARLITKDDIVVSMSSFVEYENRILGKCSNIVM